MTSTNRHVLDLEYDNVQKVPPDYFQRLIARLENASAAARRKHRSVLDLAYGPTPLERLDIFLAGKAGVPVQVFFHGGYWQALDKRDFSFVADGLAPHDVTTVIVNFPLMPQVRMNAQVAACRRALRWVYDHVTDYGGDPGRLSVSGHSAGGHLAAMLLADSHSEKNPAKPPPLDHACLVSGIYDLEPIRQCYVNDTLQLSVDEALSNSPVRMKRSSNCPLCIVVGGAEGPEYLRQSRELTEAWSEVGRSPVMRVLENENHFSLRAQFGDPDSMVVKLALGDALAPSVCVQKSKTPPG